MGVVLSPPSLRATTTAIGGRGVGNWEGDQPNFGRGGGVVFGPPGGETGSAFLRGEKGGEAKQENFLEFWQF